MNHGEVHKYLGIKLEHFKVGQVKITMLDYIDEIVDIFDKSDLTGGGTNSSAAPAILFKVYEECKIINAKQAVEFHHLLSKIVFATKRDRLDACTAILFLTTRLREPDNDNWVKLVHLKK